jgi:hypothetical protein
MPALKPAPGAIKAVVKGKLHGIAWANIYHAHYVTASPNGTEAAGWANLFYQAWKTQYLGILSQDLSLEQCDVLDLATALGAGGSHVETQIGSVFGNAAPNQLAAIVNWHTALRYRGGHPKNFIAGVPQASITTGLFLDGVFRANLDLASAGLAAAVAGMNFGAFTTQSLAVVHYRRAKTVLDPAQVEELTGHHVRSLVGSQRGRRQ